MENNKENDLKEIQNRNHIEANDWFLQNLVSVINAGNLQMGITLNVKGLIISGKLISGKEYFNIFAKNLSGAIVGDEWKEKIEKTISNYGNIYDEKDSKTLDYPSYIHLKDTGFWYTGQNPTPKGKNVLWRGRISEVDGWILGELSYEEKI